MRRLGFVHTLISVNILRKLSKCRKQSRECRAIDFPLLTLFCFNWGHRWMNTDAPRGFALVQNVFLLWNKKSLLCVITGTLCLILNQCRHTKCTATLTLGLEVSSRCARFTGSRSYPVVRAWAWSDAVWRRISWSIDLCVINIRLRELEWKSWSRKSLKGTVTLFF